MRNAIRARSTDHALRRRCKTVFISSSNVNIATLVIYDITVINIIITVVCVVANFFDRC